MYTTSTVRDICTFAVLCWVTRPFCRFTRVFEGYFMLCCSQSVCHKIDVFQTRCLRRILKIFWPRTISNEELYHRTNTAPLSVEIKRRRWRWIGHINRMALNAIPRVAMRWTPAGKRKIGRPMLTWRRSVEKEMREVGWTWSQVQRWATDRQHFSSLVTALCAT